VTADVDLPGCERTGLQALEMQVTCSNPDSSAEQPRFTVHMRWSFLLLTGSLSLSMVTDRHCTEDGLRGSITHGGPHPILLKGRLEDKA